MWDDFAAGNSLEPDTHSPGNIWKVVMEIVQSAVADFADDPLP